MVAFIHKIEGWLAHRPMPVRRRVLRGLFSTLKTFGYFKVAYAEVVQIAQALRIPIWKARAVAMEAIFQDLLFSMEWAALAVRSLDQLSKDARFVTVEDDSQLEWHSDSKSLILATLHSGCYHIAIAYLIKTYFSDRRIIIIKNFALTDQELQTIERFQLLGFDVKVFTNEAKNEFFDMMRYLKEGAVLFMLADLPKSYGKSSKVEFLDSYADLANGMIDLSIICKAPILFFGLKTSVTGERIFSDTVLDQSNVNNNVNRSVMTGYISSFVTKAIKRNPHQWQMWGRLDEYYCKKEVESSCSNVV